MRGSTTQTKDGEQGFTLIELLVVIVIIGILAAIAIPTYLSQRVKAYRTEALSDMRNVGLALETHATDNGGAYTGLDGADQDTPALRDEGFRSSEWVALSVSATATDYCVVGSNVHVPGKTFVLRSDTGRVQVLLDGTATC